jgi:hypothetical protein
MRTVILSGFAQIHLVSISTEKVQILPSIQAALWKGESRPYLIVVERWLPTILFMRNLRLMTSGSERELLPWKESTNRKRIYMTATTDNDINIDVFKPSGSPIYTITLDETWAAYMKAIRTMDYSGRQINDRVSKEIMATMWEQIYFTTRSSTRIEGQ